MPNRLLWSTAVAATLAATPLPASATVIVSTNFSSATPGSYTNGQTINSGGVTTDDILVDLTGATGSTVAVAAGAVDISRSVNSGALRLINRKAQNSAWNNVSTTATGETQIYISFDLKRTVSVGPALRLLLNTTTDSSGGTVSAIDFQVHNNTGKLGQIRYNNSTTQVSVPVATFAAALDTNYRYEFNVDLSSTTQDTFSFKITNLDTNTLAYTSPTAISTRAANVLPDRIVFNWNDVDGSVVSANRAWVVDNLNVTSNPIPEPASLVLAAAGLALLVGRRRDRI